MASFFNPRGLAHEIMTANAVTLYRRIRVADMMATGPSEA